MAGMQSSQKARTRYMVKKGNQQQMKQPTMMPKVLAAFVSILKRRTCENTEEDDPSDRVKKWTWSLSLIISFPIVISTLYFPPSPSSRSSSLGSDTCISRTLTG